MNARTVHPIEAESYRRLRAQIDLGHLPPISRAVTERIIHASADFEYAEDLVLDEAHLERGMAALRAGAPLVVDVKMVSAGITSRPAVCGLDHPRCGEVAQAEDLTRSAAGIVLAAAEAGPNAVYVVGNAPTALFTLIDAAVDPALVIGLPVGFVDAVESKQALRTSGVPAVSNRGPKGGSAVAAAAVNALLYQGDV